MVFGLEIASILFLKNFKVIYPYSDDSRRHIISSLTDDSYMKLIMSR